MQAIGDGYARKGDAFQLKYTFPYLSGVIITTFVFSVLLRASFALGMIYYFRL